MDGSEDGQRVSGELIRRVLTDPRGVQAAYDEDPDRFAALISRDVKASDVIAVANRKEQLGVFRRLLDDADYFQ